MTETQSEDLGGVPFRVLELEADVEFLADSQFQMEDHKQGDRMKISGAANYQMGPNGGVALRPGALEFR